MCATSCNESSKIGTSLIDETVAIHVDSTFTVKGRTVDNSVVLSRTLHQLVGEVNAPGYGSIHSDFVSQFMSSTAIDTANMTAENFDSVKMFLQMERSAFIGDSLVPMHLEVYRLTKDLPYPIYSDFDPSEYYDATSPWVSTSYVASTMNEPDSIKELTNIYVQMHLGKEFAQEIFHKYKQNPAAFSNPDVFTKDVFKGVYVRSSYGSGRISDFSVNSMRFYYHKDTVSTSTKNDTTIHYYGDYFAAAPEVVVNNNIKYTPADELLDMIEAGDNMLVAPTGYEVEFEFPANELIATSKNHSEALRSITALTFEIPVEEIENLYDITPPPYVLMVLKNEKDKFFANNKLPDNTTSFYAQYDETNRCYTFNGLRAYLLDLLKKEALSPNDYTFSLCPVQVDVETSGSSSNYYYYYGGSTSYLVSRITPYVSKPAMGKLLLDKAKIKLTFSTGKQNF